MTRSRLTIQSLLAIGVVLSLTPAPATAQIAEGMLSDKLEVQLTNQWNFVWSDEGSKANRNIAVWRPVTPSGWYSLGDMAQPKHELNVDGQAPYTLLVRPRKGYEDALKKPVRFKKVWDNETRKGGAAASFWVPECPSGTVALGGVAVSGSYQQDGNLRCVTFDAVVPAAWETRSIWDDAGSGADGDVTIWSAASKSSSMGTSLIFSTSTFWPMPQKGREAPKNTHWALKLSFDDVPNPAGPLDAKQLAKLMPPRLDGPGKPVPQTTELPVTTYTVPFFRVNDPRYPNTIAQWLGSPSYTIHRTTSYTFTGDEYDNTNCDVRSTGDGSLTFSSNTGWEKTTTWNNTVGGSITVSGEGAVKPLGVGFSLTVALEVNYSHEFGGSDAASGGTGIEKQWSVAKGTYGALFMRKNDYQVLRQDGTVVDTNFYNEPQAVFVQWAPPGWTAANPCPVIAGLVFPAPRELQRKLVYQAEGKNYSLIWDDIGDGDLVVLDEEDKVLFSLQDNGIATADITEVELTEAGELVARNAAGAPVWTASTGDDAKRTRLVIGRRGVLQIVGSDGRTLWSSATSAIVPAQTLAGDVSVSYPPAR